MTDVARTRTLTLTISDDDGDGVWVVWDDVSKAWGDGPDPTHALFSWLRDLDGRYRDCRDDGKHGRLGTGMAAEYARMDALLGVS